MYLCVTTDVTGACPHQTTVGGVQCTRTHAGSGDDEDGDPHVQREPAAMVRRRQRGDIRDAAHHHQHSRHRQEDRGDQARDEDTEPASGATMRRMKTTIASISQRGAPARHRNERLGIRHQEVREADTWRRAQPSAAIVVRTRAAGPATLELETNGLLK